MKKQITKTSPKKKALNNHNKQILIIAVIAIIIVLGMAFYFKTLNKSSDQVTITNTMPSAQKDMLAKMQDKLPAPKNQMIIPSKKEIIGRWVTLFGSSSIAELVLSGNGTFALIYTNDPTGKYRKFSKGNYIYDEVSGKITLSPSKAAGNPKPIPSVIYKNLTNRSYDILVSKKDGDHDLYFSALEYQIIPKSFYPLFLYADYSGAPVIKFSPIQIHKGK